MLCIFEYMSSLSFQCKLNLFIDFIFQIFNLKFKKVIRKIVRKYILLFYFITLLNNISHRLNKSLFLIIPIPVFEDREIVASGLKQLDSNQNRGKLRKNALQWKGTFTFRSQSWISVQNYYGLEIRLVLSYSFHLY